MTEHVVGDWKSFSFRMVQPADYPAVLLHLRENFYKDEPLCNYTGYDEVLADDFDVYVTDALQDNLSFMAVDKATNKIAGVRITSIVHKDEHHDLPPFKSDKTNAIVGVLVKLTEEGNVFEKYPDMKEYADFCMVSVDRDFRGHGLATEIYDRAFKMLCALDFPIIKCIFTSPYTQKIARKRGFREICQMKFSDWKNEQGESYFQDAADDELAILMVKDLK